MIIPYVQLVSLSLWCYFHRRAIITTVFSNDLYITRFKAIRNIDQIEAIIILVYILRKIICNYVTSMNADIHNICMMIRAHKRKKGSLLLLTAHTTHHHQLPIIKNTKLSLLLFGSQLQLSLFRSQWTSSIFLLLLEMMLWFHFLNSHLLKQTKIHNDTVRFELQRFVSVPMIFNLQDNNSRHATPRNTTTATTRQQLIIRIPFLQLETKYNSSTTQVFVITGIVLYHWSSLCSDYSFHNSSFDWRTNKLR